MRLCQISCRTFVRNDILVPFKMKKILNVLESGLPSVLLCSLPFFLFSQHIIIYTRIVSTPLLFSSLQTLQQESQTDIHGNTRQPGSSSTACRRTKVHLTNTPEACRLLTKWTRPLANLVWMEWQSGFLPCGCGAEALETVSHSSDEMTYATGAGQITSGANIGSLFAQFQDHFRTTLSFCHERLVRHYLPPASPSPATARDKRCLLIVHQHR